MKEPLLAAAIVREVKKAITVPLTVKMRSGFTHSNRNAPESGRICQEEGADAIAIHWRTTEDKYGGKRQIDKIAQTKAALSIPVIANGDIIDAESAIRMLQDTDCDGLMIGRGAMRNPWVFQEIHAALQQKEYIPPSIEKRRVLLRTFLNRYRDDFKLEKISLGKFKQIANHFYSGLPNGPALRMAILRSQSLKEIEENIQRFFEEAQ